MSIPMTMTYFDPHAGDAGAGAAAVQTRSLALTIVAQDPAVKEEGSRRILRAQVRVPASHLEPGPRGARFHVVDYLGGERDLANPVALLADDGSPRDHLTRKEAADREVRAGTPAVLAQNVYAIAARTLELFESSLGRRLPWAFGGHQLFIVPRAFAEANAYYDREQRALLFGFFPDPREDPAEDPRAEVFTCLSHDVVAHETTHAILDGLRPRFQEPGLPDQLAFHEAFADIVALLSVFSLAEVVTRALGPADSGRIPNDAVARERLRSSVLFGVAEQMGEKLLPGRTHGLRNSVAITPSPDLLNAPTYREPHRRGEILVAAVMDALLTMWSNRLQPLYSDRGLDRDRVAEEGAKAASHLLTMAIRAIDYTPPLEFEFSDFLDALLTADEQLAPDDAHQYRPTIEQSFAAFGIRRPAQRIVDMAAQRTRPRYDRYNYAELRASPDEVWRFLWDNAELFELNRQYALQVVSVQPTVRVGPDGFVAAETVATYVQVVDLAASELGGLFGSPIALPEGLAPTTQVQLWGGGTVIFDQFGSAKLHQTKPLLDSGRQLRRLQYLQENGLVDARRRLGFSWGTARGQRFAALHLVDADVLEGW
jgi:hypothetical protein